MENCPICDCKLADINGEIKCFNCGYIQGRNEQDMPAAIMDEDERET